MSNQKFVNITKFATMKNCSRETIYSAERKGEIDIDRSSGFPVVYLTAKNLGWKKKKSKKEFRDDLSNI